MIFFQSVVLADRPPIEIPLTSVSPALLDELISDLSSLASAYHKPESTFIGGGRLGADALARRRDEVTREKALATVVQGQQAENLLDFGEDDDDAQQKNGSTSGLGGLDELMAQADVSGDKGSSHQQSQGSQLNDLFGLYVSLFRFAGQLSLTFSLDSTMHLVPTSLVQSQGSRPFLHFLLSPLKAHL